MTQTLEQIIGNELHISSSQISTYQGCSLKYFYRYVEGIKAESISVSLPFGSAIHTALATYYRGIQNNHTEPLNAITDTFKTVFSLDVDCSEIPVTYSKSMTDKESAIAIGKKMLEAYYNSVNLEYYEVLGVELPLGANLYNPEDRQPTDFKLVGVIDLLLRNKSGDLTVVDFKTASKSMSQQSVDQDQQLSCYSYLLATNKYIAPTSSVKCRFDVLLKIKEPKLQHLYTDRDRTHRRRFARLTNMILSAIDAKIFMPTVSWMCASCEYATACKEW